MPVYRFTVFDGRDRDDPEGMERPTMRLPGGRWRSSSGTWEKTQGSGRHDWTIEVMDGSRLVWKMPFNER
jgi:hypothetical protein